MVPEVYKCGCFFLSNTLCNVQRLHYHLIYDKYGNISVVCLAISDHFYVFYLWDRGFNFNFCLRCFNSFGHLIMLSWLNSANWPMCVKLSNYVSSPHSQCLHIRAMQIRHEHTHTASIKNTQLHHCTATSPAAIKPYWLISKLTCSLQILQSYLQNLSWNIHTQGHGHTHSHTPLLFLSLYLLHLIPFGKDRCKRWLSLSQI